MNKPSHSEKAMSRKQIAIYGKGGIGKSTISANLSAAMAIAGTRVLQIGCDPKQDSTRLLLEGRRVRTVLDYLRATSPVDRSLEPIVHVGFAGVACVEAGGPEPGVGCAGRGILSALDLLESLGIGSCRYDVALYDVLGDVVCGGFAVPLREQYADVIYIVTSGEFMSLYAANNILRGVLNFEEKGPRMGGLILNSRELAHENERVRRFADAVHLPIIASFPRSEEIAAAEQLGQTVVQAFPKGVMAGRFVRLAGDLLRFVSPLPAQPLSPDGLESVVQNGAIHHAISSPFVAPSLMQAGKPFLNGPANFPPARLRQYHSKSVKGHEVLHGCAFNGAVHTLTQIMNVVTLAHGPRSCAYISGHGMVSAARRANKRFGSPLGPVPPLVSSEMDEGVVIFGGNDSLEKGIVKAVNKNPEAVFIVTTCAAGIIGDNMQAAVDGAIRSMSPADTSYVPSSPCDGGSMLSGADRIISIATDGDINGDYMQGIIDAMITVGGRFIDRTVKPDPDTVNIVGEKNLATNTEANYITVREMLEALGLRVNCRFIRNCTLEQIANFLKGRLNLLASADLCGRMCRNYLADNFGAEFLSAAFPVGFKGTKEWLTELAGVFGKEAEAEEIIKQANLRYENALAPLRPSLKGKRLFIVTQSYQIDWVLDLALDLDMEIMKVGILQSSWDDEFVSKYEGRFPLVLSYTRARRDEEICSLAPDLTLTNVLWRGQPDKLRVDAISMVPDAGFESGVAVAQRWHRLMQLPPKEGWRHDI